MLADIFQFLIYAKDFEDGAVKLTIQTIDALVNIQTSMNYSELN
jgi:hypothetical protein